MSENDTDNTVETAGQDTLDVGEFRAELDVFSGPLDLLLYLIRRDEVDILEIPIAAITEQYLGVLRAMQKFDVNLAAEFLVMAATLMDIKSRSLLPESIEEEQEEDPRDELVRQLLKYKRFKQLAGRLEEMAEAQALKFPRVPPKPDLEPEEPAAEELLEEITLWDLVSAYGEVTSQLQTRRPQQIVYDDVPLSVYIEEVEQRLGRLGGPVPFLDFLEEDHSRGRVIGLFLALLELVRQRRICIEQPEGDRCRILVRPAARPPERGEASAGAGPQRPGEG